MTGMTDYWARKVLDHSTGKTAIGSVPSVWVGLFLTMPTDANTGGTEVSGTGYARKSTAAGDWNAAGSSAPATVSNLNAIQFAAATGDWTAAGATPVVGFGLFDAVTAGNLLFFDWLGNFSWLPFTCTSASPGVLTANAHGYANADQVVVTAEYGGVLPTTGGSWAGLKTVAAVTTDTFTAGVNTTGTGNGLVRKVATQLVPSGVTASFAAGALVLSLA